MMDSWKKQNDVWLLLHYHATDNREKYPAKKIVHKWEEKKCSHASTLIAGKIKCTLLLKWS